MRLILNWLISTAAILIAGYLLPGVFVEDLVAALVLAAVLGLINAIVRPILLVLTLPISILTLGLFTFVINALLVLLAAELVPGFAVASFWWALLFSLVTGLVNGFLKGMAGPDTE